MCGRKSWCSLSILASYNPTSYIRLKIGYYLEVLGHPLLSALLYWVPLIPDSCDTCDLHNRLTSISGDRYSRVVFTSASGDDLWNLPAIKSMCSVENMQVGKSVNFNVVECTFEMLVSGLNHYSAADMLQSKLLASMYCYCLIFLCTPLSAPAMPSVSFGIGFSEFLWDIGTRISSDFQSSTSSLLQNSALCLLK